jgi:hypothetical protein
VTPELIRDYLLHVAGITIDLEEAKRLLPYVRGSVLALNRLYRFDVQYVRPSHRFDPTFPYEPDEQVG